MIFRLLFVDGHQKFSPIIPLLFPKCTWTTTVLRNCTEAAQSLQTKLFDVVILYVPLVADDAWKDMVSFIRSTHIDAGVILLMDECPCLLRLTALQLGVDEVISGDFHPKELQIQVEKILLRLQPYQNCVLETPYFSFDTRTGVIKNEVFSAILRRKEYQLLSLFIHHRNMIVNKMMIMEKLWSPDEMPLYSTIDVHVRRVRLKIHDYEKKIIKTVYGMGYIFVDPQYNRTQQPYSHPPHA